MKLIVLPAAELEAADAAVWYDDQKQGLGDAFLAESKSALDQLRTAPNLAARLEDYAGDEEVRRHLMMRFPYIVVFACRPYQLIVIAVSHSRRRPQYWLKRLDTI